MRILIFGAHPDDIEICMGGTVSKYIKENNEVLGVTGCVPDQVETRIKELEKGSELLNFRSRVLDCGLGMQIGDIKEYTLVSETDKIIKEFNPDIVFTHWDKDPHNDHVRLTNAVRSSMRNSKAELIMFSPPNINILNITDFSPNLLVDISDEFPTKVKAINAHSSQLEEEHRKDWIENIKIFNRYYGQLMNVAYAEGFIIQRKFIY